MAYGYPSSLRRRKRRRYVPRSVSRVRGRGSYMGELGRTILQGGGGALGTFLGGGPLNPVGAVVGAGLGSTGGSMIADALGMGAYSVKANSLLMDEGQQIPAFGDMSDCVVVKHREFITDIAVPALPAGFNNTQFVINPGSQISFPWLANIANSFESYMLLGCIYEFKSTSADIGSVASLGMGTVIMATDYDAHDPPATSKLIMENMQYSSSAKPSESFCHIIECDPSVNVQPHLYVRPNSGALGVNEDTRFYDHGNFQIATAGLPAGSSGVLGELWVTYQVAFFKPQIGIPSVLTTDWYGTLGNSTSAYWGTSAVRSLRSSLGSSVLGNTLFFPGGSSLPPKVANIGDLYWISYSCFGASTNLTSVITVTTVDCNVALLDQQSPVTTTRQWFNGKFLVTGPNPSVTITGGTLPASVLFVRVLVARLDSTVNLDIL